MEEINIESDAGAEIKIPGPKGTGYFFILTTNILIRDRSRGVLPLFAQGRCSILLHPDG